MNRHRSPGRDLEAAVERGLGTVESRVHRARVAGADRPVEGVFGVGGMAHGPRAIHRRHVRFVVGEQRGVVWRGGSEEPALSEAGRGGETRRDLGPGVVGHQADRAGEGRGEGDLGRWERGGPPRPGVAEPERGEDVEPGCVGAAVGGGDPDGDLLRPAFRILDDDVEIAAVVEGSRVGQLKLRPAPLPGHVFGDELGIGEGGLWIAVEEAHEGVGRRVVDMHPPLLGILAMIPLPRGDAEQTLLEVRIGTVPKGRGEAEELVAVREPGDPVLPPAIGLGPGVLVGEIVPCIAVGGVVFTDGTPGAVGEVRPPPAPAPRFVGDLPETLLFRIQGIDPAGGWWRLHRRRRLFRPILRGGRT